MNIYIVIWSQQVVFQLSFCRFVSFSDWPRLACLQCSVANLKKSVCVCVCIDHFVKNPTGFSCMDQNLSGPCWTGQILSHEWPSLSSFSAFCVQTGCAEHWKQSKGKQFLLYYANPLLVPLGHLLAFTLWLGNEVLADCQGPLLSSQNVQAHV